MTNPGPTSLISTMNEDYYNQFSFSQIMMSNNHGNNVNNGMSLNSGSIGGHNAGHYSYHTLQPTQSVSAHPGQHHLLGSVNSSYAQIAGPSSSVVYGTKLISRTPPYPIVNSNSASSPSASSSSNSSSSSLNHSSQGGQLGSSTNGINNTNSSGADGHDYHESSHSQGGSGANQSNGPNSVPNPADPAEIVRQKQMRGLKLTQDEIQLLVKDRQRKDNHNMSKKL